jgi:predicted small lipoprotein YifL
LRSKFKDGYNKYWKSPRDNPLEFSTQLPVIVVTFFKRKLQMKKSLVFVAMLAIALAACGKKEEAKPAEAPAAAPAAPAAPAADAKK